MISVKEAEHIILSQTRDYGTEEIRFDKALGRTLAENLLADRDLPPYNRVTMDGIAINYIAFQNGIRDFHIKAIQAAGDTPVDISENECVEIMTGAALPATADTVIRYEDLQLKNGMATVNTEKIKKGQNIHIQGIDKKQNEIVAKAGQIISPALINIAASIGKTELLVKKLPKVLIITTGDELVAVEEIPLPFQVRRSNDSAIKAVLTRYCIAADTMHLADNVNNIKKELAKCLQQYDVILLSGGISKGKYDYLPAALEELVVKKLFHGVTQRPGKPFWFGLHENGTMVFAFPGNPVSAFLCLHRYFLPWLEKSSGLEDKTPAYAILEEDFSFSPPLQYFLQVKLSMNNKAQLLATPVEGHGSGDFANLLNADAFMELPAEKSNFNKGEVFRVWSF